jgi:hypothetical protein
MIGTAIFIVAVLAIGCIIFNHNDWGCGAA